VLAKTANHQMALVSTVELWWTSS